MGGSGPAGAWATSSGARLTEVSMSRRRMGWDMGPRCANVLRERTRRATNAEKGREQGKRECAGWLGRELRLQKAQQGIGRGALRYGEPRRCRRARKYAAPMLSTGYTRDGGRLAAGDARGGPGTTTGRPPSAM